MCTFHVLVSTPDFCDILRLKLVSSFWKGEPFLLLILSILSVDLRSPDCTIRARLRKQHRYFPNVRTHQDAAEPATFIQQPPLNGRLTIFSIGKRMKHWPQTVGVAQWDRKDRHSFLGIIYSINALMPWMTIIKPYRILTKKFYDFIIRCSPRILKSKNRKINFYFSSNLSPWTVDWTLYLLHVGLACSMRDSVVQWPTYSASTWSYSIPCDVYLHYLQHQHF